MKRSYFSFYLKFVCALWFFFFSILPYGYCLDKSFDHSTWDQFLKKFVNENGDVDYSAVKADPALLNEYFRQLEDIDGEDFKANWPREERMAIFLNAYNAGIIRAITRVYPVPSVQSVPGVWENYDIKIAGHAFSLNNILVDGLIRTFRDEKIHLVLSAGAKSSPRLRAEAFTGPKVEGQLFVAVKEFVNNPKMNQITPGEKKIRISELFKWHAADFLLDFGSREIDERFTNLEMAALSFLAHYLDDEEKVTYLEERNYKIQYLPFDWNLNDWHSEQKKEPASA
ncbi:MAG: DUF547 domain-containing protein [Candidatus Omnitrophica bacterium]|nr:DUF547 domain-containing protein [Candidatus Omnitrophota bacterium]